MMTIFLETSSELRYLYQVVGLQNEAFRQIHSIFHFCLEQVEGALMREQGNNIVQIAIISSVEVINANIDLFVVFIFFGIDVLRIPMCDTHTEFLVIGLSSTLVFCFDVAREELQQFTWRLALINLTHKLSKAAYV